MSLEDPFYYYPLIHTLTLEVVAFYAHSWK